MRLWSVEGNRQRLDGGAMYGNAPRALWEKWTPPDAQNRIEFACRCFSKPRRGSGYDGRYSVDVHLISSFSNFCWADAYAPNRPQNKAARTLSRDDAGEFSAVHPKSTLDAI